MNRRSGLSSIVGSGCIGPADIDCCTAGADYTGDFDIDTVVVDLDRKSVHRVEALNCTWPF
jgi:hypothetical protein